MGEKSFSKIQQEVNEADLSALPKFAVSVLRNVTVEAIEPYLRHLAYEQGVNVRLKFGEFDNVVQEALGAAEGLLHERTDCVLVFLQLDTLSQPLAREFAALSRSRVEEEVERIHGLVRSVLTSIRRQTPAMLLWHGFETPLNPALGIIDGNDRNGQSDVIAGLNGFVRDELGALGGAYFVDMDRCRARVGGSDFYDRRYWHIGRAPYSRRALREIAAEDFKFIRALQGLHKKCLVLDCDNVLWGGVVGEDGVAGIKLDRTYPGSPYWELQQAVLQLYHRGVILALNSKNNEEDVWEVFDSHPNMLLKRDHIAAWRINWRDKATNLRELAAELNIGIESIVFVDDSEFEIDRVRAALPEAHTVHLPVSGAVGNRDRLLSLGLFDTLTRSQEDRKRGEMYRAESQRKRLQTEIADLDSYYRSLDMELEIRLATSLSIPRIAQLTQKTNQFNLTTRRYSEEDIQRLANAEDSEVMSLRLTDRFGDSGIVGVCVLRYERGSAVFDTFLMSCRVLGRKVEDAFAVHCLRRGRSRGCERAVGLYVPTVKNRMAANFFERLSFERREEVDGVQRFELDLNSGISPAPPFFKQIDSEAGAESASEHEDT